MAYGCFIYDIRNGPQLRWESRGIAFTKRRGKYTYKQVSKSQARLEKKKSYICHPFQSLARPTCAWVPIWAKGDRLISVVRPSASWTARTIQYYMTGVRAFGQKNYWECCSWTLSFFPGLPLIVIDSFFILHSWSLSQSPNLKMSEKLESIPLSAHQIVL